MGGVWRCWEACYPWNGYGYKHPMLVVCVVSPYSLDFFEELRYTLVYIYVFHGSYGPFAL